MGGRNGEELGRVEKYRIFNKSKGGENMKDSKSVMAKEGETAEQKGCLHQASWHNPCITRWKERTDVHNLSFNFNLVKVGLSTPPSPSQIDE